MQTLRPEPTEHVEGLGVVAGYETSENFNTLWWFPDGKIQMQLDALRGYGQELTKDELINLAREVTVPVVLPSTTAPS